MWIEVGDILKRRGVKYRFLGETYLLWNMEEWETQTRLL